MWLASPSYRRGVEPTPSTALILYDGVCGFCDRFVQWLMQIDRRQQFRYAPLQGVTAATVRQRHPEMPTDLDSVVLVESDGEAERVLWHASAALRILELAGIESAAVRWAKRLPRPVLDLAYRSFAALRYRMFGKLKECRVPSPAERTLFLP